MTNNQAPVNYETFGAIGDGVTDDLPAICKAHEHANAHGLPVRSRPDATYHLGRRALTAIIATDTDWNTSRFTIDDSVDVEDPKRALFEVQSLLAPVSLKVDRLTRDQKHIDVHPESDCFVQVTNEHHRKFIRRGLNRNKGGAQHDCFILRRDGSIDAPIDWDYDQITAIEARPIDATPLTIRGGVFTTIANRVEANAGYDAWTRNITIRRSNTQVVGLIHYVVGETAVGKPYSGFLRAMGCANITFRDCFATGHKMYHTIGSAGKPVAMGSYDYLANNVVNFHMVGCRQNLILDRTRWGVIATNFCKNITLEDCTLSRMDTHMGVSGGYTFRRCTLGHMGLNAIGRGPLVVEDSTLFGPNLIAFRRDYGSTWDGDVVIRNCHWTPNCGEVTQPHLFATGNDGMHNFGYPCSMPRTITIDGLTIDDANHPEDYQGPYLFTDPDIFNDGVNDTPLIEDRPFPYAPCATVTLRNLRTTTGQRPRISPNATLQPHIEIIDENQNN